MNENSNFLVDNQNFKSNNNKSQNETEEQVKSLNEILPISKLSKLSRNMYYSEDFNTNEKNFASSSTTSVLNNNISKKNSSQDALQNPILVSPSKKKKSSSFKMIEKSKYKKNNDLHVGHYAKKEEQEAIPERERKDAFGNEIKKKNKRKIKVSFIDEINKDQPLVTIIDIECFKKYNFIIGMPKEEHIKKNYVNTNCQCCYIF